MVCLISELLKCATLALAESHNFLPGFVIELGALAGRYADLLYSTAPPSKSHRGSVARIRDAWEDAKACEIPLESSPK